MPRRQANAQARIRPQPIAPKAGDAIPTPLQIKFRMFHELLRCIAAKKARPDGK